MSKLEQTVARLATALDALEHAVSERSSAGLDADAGGGAALDAERDRLAAEVARLERQVHEDAELRAEAANAVRAALTDLRAVAGNGAATGARGG